MNPIHRPEPGFTGNLFLESLSTASAARLLPKLRHFESAIGTPIAHAGQPIDYVYFPIASVISAVTRMRDGSDVEVMVIGREAFFGVQSALGETIGGSEAMVQVPDAAWRIESSAFLECLESDAELNRKALRYASFMIETVSQFAACNRLHTINARCARWLLMAHDRVGSDTIILTQEYLATMLGVRRPGVSLAASVLERAGLIDYSRGRIVVLNRRGLEAVACECYAIANAALERILGYGVRKTPAVNGEAL